MKKKKFETLMEPLHLELNNLERWLQHTGRRMVVLFEGRDTAGKGGVINTIMERLNPRQVHLVALGKPTDRDRTSGTSSATCRTFRRPGKWCCSTAAGTTAPASRR